MSGASSIIYVELLSIARLEHVARSEKSRETSKEEDDHVATTFELFSFEISRTIFPVIRIVTTSRKSFLFPSINYSLFQFREFRIARELLDTFEIPIYSQI